MPSIPDATELDVADLHSDWLAARPGGPRAQMEVVRSAWARLDVAASSATRLSDLAARFAARLDATGVACLTEASPADCDAFLWAPTRRNRTPSLHTVHLRRTAVRTLYRIIQAFDPDAPDPTRHLDLPAKPEHRSRPLTTAEIDLVRTAALGRSRGAVRAAATVALAEATATTGELTRLRWADLDLEAGTVVLPGAAPVLARTGALTDWGRGVLYRWHISRPHDDRDLILARATTGATRYASQAAMVSYLGRILLTAGLTGPDIRPNSIRLWGAARLRAEHGIEAVATALGIDSLDAASAAIGYDWRARS